MRIFLEEMRQVSHLQHPNIVQVHGIEHVEEDTAIVMDYVPWPTLKARKSQTMPVGEVIHILKQVASALDFAQAKKILHRDIRPSNVFYDRQSGQVMVSDFGIVRLVESTHALVRTTINTPLPGYSAPEQNQGLHYNPYSDVYSLAVLAYELLTGGPPFDALTPHSVLSRQLRYIPESPSRVVEGLPPAADEVILKALEPKPENRFATSTEFVESLVQAVGPELAQRPPVQSEAEAGEEAAVGLESHLEQTTVVAPDVDAETAERIFCPICGTGNSASSRRCSNCWGSLVAQPVVSVEEEEKTAGALLGAAEEAQAHHLGSHYSSHSTVCGMVGIQSDRDAPAPARPCQFDHRCVRPRRMGNGSARQLPHRPGPRPGLHSFRRSGVEIPNRGTDSGSARCGGRPGVRWNQRPAHCGPGCGVRQRGLGICLGYTAQLDADRGR